VVALGPVLYIVLGVFRTNAQITVNPSGLPNPWEWQNYSTVLKGSSFWRQFSNSLIVGGLTGAVKG
jgi:raffinose/stachyose/melibiose transport system permease protein